MPRRKASDSDNTPIVDAIVDALHKNKKLSNERELIATFECGPYTWKEYKVPKNSNYLDSGSADLEVQGICLHNSQEIYMCDGLGRTMRDEVRLHERLHAIFYSYFNSLDFANVEEELVTGIARGLLQIKKSNKKA